MEALFSVGAQVGARGIVEFLRTGLASLLATQVISRSANILDRDGLRCSLSGDYRAPRREYRINSKVALRRRSADISAPRAGELPPRFQAAFVFIITWNP